MNMNKNKLFQRKPPPTRGTPLGAIKQSNSSIDNDMERRGDWQVGSKVEVWSSSSEKWVGGVIHRIFYDDEGEWLEVNYAVGSTLRLKQIPRDDLESIRPARVNYDNNIGMNRGDTSITSTISPLSPNNRINSKMPPSDPHLKRSLSAISTLSGASDNGGNLDERIRNSWVRGAIVEVFSRGRKKWLRGIITKIFVDDEGEWLEVRYGNNLIKEVPRDSCDIRPIRARIKPDFALTDQHRNKVQAIWQDVDLEATKHLDLALVTAVFGALNINTTDHELHALFQCCDKEERGAINCDEFCDWLGGSVETAKHRDLQKKIFYPIDDIVKGKTMISQELQQKEKQKKLEAIYQANYDKDMSEISHFQLTSRFEPAPSPMKDNISKQTNKPPLRHQTISSQNNSINNELPPNTNRTVIFRNGRFVSVDANDLNNQDNSLAQWSQHQSQQSQESQVSQQSQQSQFSNNNINNNNSSEYDDFNDIYDDVGDENNEDFKTNVMFGNDNDMNNNNSNNNSMDYDYYGNSYGALSYGLLGGMSGMNWGLNMGMYPMYMEFDASQQEELEQLMFQEEMMNQMQCLEFSDRDEEEEEEEENENENENGNNYENYENYDNTQEFYEEYDNNNNRLEYQVKPPQQPQPQPPQRRRSSLKPSSIEVNFQMNGIDKKTRDSTILKLQNLGIYDKYMTANADEQAEEYHSKLNNVHFNDKILNNNEYLQNELNEIQLYMRERCKKSGVDGLRMTDLSNAVHRKFVNFDRKKYIPSKKARFADFVYLCPGLVIVEMDNDDGTADRIAVTRENALKINLKQKMQFVLAMLFDKSKLTNSLEVIKSVRDMRGRLKQRRLSVGERLLTSNDFCERLINLNVNLTDLELDELFWAIAGCNALMLSQNMVGRYFASLVDHLKDPVEPHLVDNLGKIIDIARLQYRRTSLWDKYIIIKTISKWNNINYIRLTDRRTRSKYFDMIAIPKTKSVHSQYNNIEDVQRSFHSQCSILNQLQYPTIAKKKEHSVDRYNYCCVTYTPHLRSFPDMLEEANERNISYSEYFIAQVIGSILETVLFCHKHNVVNLNLNIDCLGFDTHLRPIILDFSRSFFLTNDDYAKVTKFNSVVSSTPTELALMMGSMSPVTGMEMNGFVLRKADAWRVGVLLYILITGMLPYPASSLNNFITHILTQPPVIPIECIKCSQGLKNLLKHLLDGTYFSRTDIQTALRDPWFKNRNKEPLSTDVYDKIKNLCKIEQCRNLISTITHNTSNASNDDGDRVSRDRKYFVRMDLTGQRKSLRIEMLNTFIEDRLDYCPYKAREIVNQFKQEFTDNNDSADPGHVTWKQFIKHYRKLRDSINIDKTLKLTNAIFSALDEKGNGNIDSILLKALFDDIGLELEEINEKLDNQPQMAFNDVYNGLQIAFKEGFSINDLLSVDHVVVGA